MERVKSELAPSGVAVAGRSIKVQDDLIDSVPRKHRELFIAVCGIVEKEIAGLTSKEKRKELYEKLAELFMAF